MADNETITDIIAWLRKPREGENAYHTLWRDEIAARLEAAHKRELSTNGADFGQLGDCAKLREALVKCREIALQWQADEAAGVAGTTDKPHARSAAEAVIDMEFEINAALSAPPRNCDRPECATTKAAQEVWRKEDGGKTAYYEWLLATHKKGDNDGNK